MDSFRAKEKAYYEEEYEKIFSRVVKRKSKAKTIMSIEVKKTEMSAIEVVVRLFDGSVTTYSFPGCREEDKDRDFIVYYGNKVVAPALFAHDPLNQEAIDNILDQLLNETSDDSPLDLDKLMKLGRKVNWAVSAAVCKAAACSKNISFYEHLVVLPLEADSFRESLQIITKIYDCYFKAPTEDNCGQNAIDEGGHEHEGCYTPSIQDIKNCLELLTRTIADLGYTKKVSVGLYIGASKFYGHDKTYHLNFNEENGDGSPKISGAALKDVYESLLSEFDIVSFEDLFHLDDREYSSKITREIWDDAQVVMGDDCMIDEEMFESIADDDVCNSFLLKVGQIGSVTKCIEIVLRCKYEHWGVVMSSHDSCQTSDTFVADLCVGLVVEQIKIGVSCITGACKICNRIREIEIEQTEEICSMILPTLDRMYDVLLTMPEKYIGDRKHAHYDIVSGRITREEFKKMSIETLRQS